MPRGRHRHSPPLHRLLPPSTIAGVSVLCASGAWLFAEPVVLRSLAAGAAAAAVVAAVVMRRWDRTAGKRVAELTRARAGDEWRHEELVAELESDVEESRELRTRLENKLRSKRGELAALRGEHAALLRRYATAETERASALEGRRRLAIEAAAPAKALPPAGSGPDKGGPRGTTTGGLSPSLYLRAGVALDNLTRNGADQANGSARRTGSAAAASGGDAAPAEPSPGEPVTGAASHERSTAETETPATEQRALSGQQSAVSAAAAVVPHRPRRVRAMGGFDFFGTKADPADGTDGSDAAEEPRVAADDVQNEDLADVVGAEALAIHKAESEAEFRAPGDGERAVGQVIDLTAHDETEQLDVAELRSAIS
ncbi:hypothetical protein DSC45_25290 [Streptomyces sp. YIM 130001]|uniref:hypothetical protein n=1 Tax=Streptomyces sp. YIM 130001 TaxID=2259644 RepID=UPI000E65DF4B|nr:hypothetical protein [Streptomyces sp. YIM 130001]RII12464.1 hypothetical protein DSC45_25290 [Streptomyces sp. YIM 130001]